MSKVIYSIKKVNSVVNKKKVIIPKIKTKVFHQSELTGRNA